MKAKNSTRLAFNQIQAKQSKKERPRLMRERYLQASAEAIAFKLIRDRLWDMRDEEEERLSRMREPMHIFIRKYEFTADEPIQIEENVTHIGLFVIQPELGGGAVLVTGW